MASEPLTLHPRSRIYDDGAGLLSFCIIIIHNLRFLLFFLIYMFLFKKGAVLYCRYAYVHEDTIQSGTDPVTHGDLITLELNLSSEDPAQRTLRFFINNKQQPFVITHVPPAVQFAVCYLSPQSSIHYTFTISTFLFFFFISIPFLAINYLVVTFLITSRLLFSSIG